MRVKTHRPRPVTPPGLADELVDRVYDSLSDLSWSARLKALTELLDQLHEDIEDLDMLRATFPLFLEKLIDRFGGPDIDNIYQARIYVGSARQAHRDAADRWLPMHDNDHVVFD
ncbi:MAG: hypothetical protein MI806_23660 [Minwuiales bacterium]|nr:hypothetical protein [Minwuiales bacterium]